MKIPTARKLPSGMWHIRLRINGQDISITRATEKECIAEAVAIKAGGKSPRKSAADLTIGECIDRLIEDRSGIYSPATILLCNSVKTSGLKSIMNRKISSLSDRDYQRAINQAIKSYSPATIKTDWAYIVSAIKNAGGEKPSVALPKVQQSDGRFLDQEELKIFCDYIKGHRLEIPILIAMHGLRASEVCGMEYNDIKLDGNGSLSVRATIVRGQKGLERVERTKTVKSKRVIPFVLPQLRTAISLVPSEKRHGAITNMSPEAISTAIKRLSTKAGVTPISAHDLRRTFATICHAQNIPEHYVMEWGGWSNIQTIHKVYVKLDQKAGAEFAKRFVSAFQNGNENGNEISQAK